MEDYTMIRIVRKGDSAPLKKSLREAGAPGGTIVNAKGTATSFILASLGLGDTRKEILYNIINKDDKQEFMDDIHASTGKGVVVMLDCYRSIERKMEDNMESNWTMIEVICADGMSDDIMAVARKAGARGGTVISGRGTSTEADVKFFGAPLVPEKELLMIVVDNKIFESVYSAISEMEILKKKGMGILFALPVRDFKVLG